MRWRPLGRIDANFSTRQGGFLFVAAPRVRRWLAAERFNAWTCNLPRRAVGFSESFLARIVEVGLAPAEIRDSRAISSTRKVWRHTRKTRLIPRACRSERCPASRRFLTSCLLASRRLTPGECLIAALANCSILAVFIVLLFLHQKPPPPRRASHCGSR